MTTSEQVNEIAAALAKAQAGMKNAALNKMNPHFRSKYADLAGIRDAVIPALAAQGIAMVQTLDYVPSTEHLPIFSVVETRLVHTSGQWIESTCLLPSVPDMQKMGSAITYARRYSLSAICGIAADEDDDANEAARPTQAAKPEPEKAPAPTQSYEDWLIDINSLAESGAGKDAVTKAVVGSHADYKNRLRADRAKWKAIEEKATKSEAVPA